MAGADEQDVLLAAVPLATGAVLLARSDHAVVYRVDSPRESVIVKVGRPERIRAELDAVAVLDGHDLGVAVPLTSGELAGYGYLARRWYTSTLADLIMAGPRSGEELVRLLAPVAHVLARLHRAGHVLTDLKPANLVLDGAQARIADFGDVVPIGALAARLTPGFAAPELVAGARAMPAADVYSLAVVILTALTGGVDWLRVPEAALDALPPPAQNALRTALNPCPDGRRIGPRDLVVALAEARLPPLTAATGPAEVGQRIAFDKDPGADPASASAPGPAGRTHGERAANGDVAAPTATAADGPDLSARSPWGAVALDARTVDRPPLLPRPEASAEAVATSKPLWRHPAMLASIAAALVMCAVATVLIATGGRRRPAGRNAAELSALKITTGQANTELTWDGPDVAYSLILLSTGTGPRDASLYVRGRLAFVPVTVVRTDACFLVRPASTPLTAPIPPTATALATTGSTVGCIGSATFATVKKT
jgi:hypothetical protein